jgi:hypothetical protein
MHRGDCTSNMRTFALCSPPMLRNLVVVLACSGCAAPVSQSPASSSSTTVSVSRLAAATSAPVTLAAPTDTAPPPVSGPSVVFEGMCDASGAIPVDERCFAVTIEEIEWEPDAKVPHYEVAYSIDGVE